MLVSGATGFIGAQLLHDLLTRTRATAHCLVRAHDTTAAHDRVVANLTRYRLWDDRFAGRIVVVPGDLSAPALGLSGDAFDELAATVDTIVHNGAMVHLARSYRAHYDTNVGGTLDIIRLATTGRSKPIHFISTLGTIAVGPTAPPEEPTAPPEDPTTPRAHLTTALDDPTAPLEGPTGSRPPADGYSQSKWVGERLLEAAAMRGLAVTIHRVGEVMPHSHHGVPSRSGLADLLVKACVTTGLWFRSPIVMDYTQVECISGAVIAAATAGESGHFHPVQSGLIKLDDLLLVFRSEYDLTEVTYPVFRARVASRVVAQPEHHDLARLLALLPAPPAPGNNAAPDPDAANADATNSDATTSDAMNTSLSDLFRDAAAGRTGPRARKLIGAAGLTWQPVGPEVFRNYAAYYRSPAGIEAVCG